MASTLLSGSEANKLGESKQGVHHQSFVPPEDASATV